ncbi:MAG: DUF2283 domain-containing protein [Planctomycetales bacterium]
MKHCYLEVTFRKGRALAAYYYLPRRGTESSARTERFEGGFIVDYASDGTAIGIEITAPSRLDISQLNRILERIGHEPVAREDLAPLVAA